MPSWKTGYNPNLIAQRMEKVKKVSGTGKISFTGFEYFEHAVLLNSMIEVDDEIPEIEKRLLINQARFRAGEKGRITPKSILTELAKLENKYLSTKTRKYRLITNLSLSPFCQIPWVRFSDSCIVVHARTNKVIQNSRSNLMKDAIHSVGGDLPKNYATVSVSVNARSGSEAAEKALERLDFIRGIWNFWINRGQGIRRSSGRRKPVNRLVLGPVHTLHLDSGKLATESWWYEPQYQGPITRYNSFNKIENMIKFMKSFRAHFNKTKYQSDIVQAVVRYVRALDSRDWDDSFLRLWGVLELLTGTQKDSYKVTVRRASFMMADREYARQVLSHLRDYRNQFVHAGSESSQVESLMYQVKRYVEILIEFHIGNTIRFESMAEAAEFMDFPNDKLQIEKKIKKLLYAKTFVSS